MIEVEAKVAIDNLREVRRRAGILGKFAGRKRKVDDYYTLEEIGSYPKRSLRIRKIDGYYIVNFKKSRGYENGVHVKKEVEFKVSNIDDFLRLIKDFGFRKWLTKDKESEVYHVGKNFNIEVNKVKELGWFVEVEYLAEPAEIKNARKKVSEVIQKLGYSMKDCIKAGYTKQLWKKMYKRLG